MKKLLGISVVLAALAAGCHCPFSDKKDACEQGSCKKACCTEKPAGDKCCTGETAPAKK